MSRTIIIASFCLVLLGFSGCGQQFSREVEQDSPIGPMSVEEGVVEDSVIEEGDEVENLEDSETISGLDTSVVLEPPPEPVLVQPVVAVVDQDGDWVNDNHDNCRGLYNPDQIDADRDGWGDDCDTKPYGEGYLDSDQDGITDLSDNCPTVYNPEQGGC